MFKQLLGPKHTFKDALLILEQGLQSGEITLNGKDEIEGAQRGKNITMMAVPTDLVPEIRAFIEKKHSA